MTLGWIILLRRNVVIRVTGALITATVTVTVMIMIAITIEIEVDIEVEIGHIDDTASLRIVPITIIVPTIVKVGDTLGQNQGVFLRRAD